MAEHTVRFDTRPRPVRVPTGTLLIGLAPEGLFAVASQAADQLANPEIYVRAVLEAGR